MSQQDKVVLDKKQNTANTNRCCSKLMLIIVVLFFIASNGLAYYLGKNNQAKMILLEPSPTEIKSSPDAIDASPSAGDNTVRQMYPKPANWTTLNREELGISLCLPPKWEFNDHGGQVYFARDPGYRPAATYIEYIPYKGGSRREEYINAKTQYEYDPKKLKQETTVQEIAINDKSVLKIRIPSFSEVLVFTTGDRLFSVNSEYEPLVNDSPLVFQKDIYTIVGCIETL